ncbi:MAG: SDR family oxidoreductase [Pseudomonadota bacterium]
MSDIFNLEGKTALVTGGSRGIGYMIAHGFVSRGVKVYISSRKADVCDAAARKLGELGDCVSIPADISKIEEIDKLVALVAAESSGINILVNNAGATWGAKLDEFPEAGWDKVLNTNSKGIFFLTQKLLPMLESAATKENPASVINIGSIDGLHTSLFENFSYGASKAAVHHMTKVLATHLAPRSITVNCIAPGPFATDMMAPMIEQMEETIVGQVPLKRMGGPDDIAGLTTLLASRAGAYITGTVIPLDGGVMGAS